MFLLFCFCCFPLVLDIFIGLGHVLYKVGSLLLFFMVMREKHETNVLSHAQLILLESKLA